MGVPGVDTEAEGLLLVRIGRRAWHTAERRMVSPEQASPASWSGLRSQAIACRSTTRDGRSATPTDPSATSPRRSTPRAWRRTSGTRGFRRIAVSWGRSSWSRPCWARPQPSWCRCRSWTRPRRSRSPEGAGATLAAGSLVVLTPEQLSDGTVLDRVVLGRVSLACGPLRLQLSASRVRFVALITGPCAVAVAGLSGLLSEVKDLIGGAGGFRTPALRRRVVPPPVLGRRRVELLRHPGLGGRPRSLVFEVCGVVLERRRLGFPGGGCLPEGGPGGGLLPQGGYGCGLPLGGLSGRVLGRRLAGADVGGSVPSPPDLILHRFGVRLDQVGQALEELSLLRHERSQGGGGSSPSGRRDLRVHGRDAGTGS